MSDVDHVLALEHEAVWTYGVIGGAFPELEERAGAAFRAHRDERDRLLQLVVDPPPPQSSYAPAVIVDAPTALVRAQDIEARLTATWSAIVGAATGPEARDDAIERLLTAETARLSWGGSAVAFPGLAPQP